MTDIKLTQPADEWQALQDEFNDINARIRTMDLPAAVPLWSGVGPASTLNPSFEVMQALFDAREKRERILDRMKRFARETVNP